MLRVNPPVSLEEPALYDTRHINPRFSLFPLQILDRLSEPDTD